MQLENGEIKKRIPFSEESAFLRKFPANPPDEPAVPPPAKSRVAVRWIVRLLVCGLLAAVFMGLYQYSHDRGLYEIRNVVLQGFYNLDKNEVLALINSSFPRNLMEIDLEMLRQRVEKYNWVKSVIIRKVYPDKLHIKIEERVPAGIARIDKLWLFDENGIFLDEYRPASHQIDLPVLVGLQDGTSGTAQDDNMEKIRRYLGFLKDIDAGERRLSKDLSEIDLTDLTNLVILPLDGVPRVLLGQENLNQRLNRYFQIIGRAVQENGPVAEVDMRYDDKVIVRPVTPVTE